MTREEAIEIIKNHKVRHEMRMRKTNWGFGKEPRAIYISEALDMAIEALEREPALDEIGHCKDCKYFEYDSVAKVNGIPLIVAHEICSRWGNGCKTKEDGYCFLFEPQEGEG